MSDGRNYTDEDYRQLHSAHCVTEAQRDAAVKEIERLRDLLGEYQAAVMVDIHMDGPEFMSDIQLIGFWIIVGLLFLTVVWGTWNE